MYSPSFQVLLPLQHVKGNFVRIHSVLNELKASLEDGTRGWSSNQDISVVGLGIQEAVGMFQRQAQNLLVVRVGSLLSNICKLSYVGVFVMSDVIRQMPLLILINIL